jgi:hypothetical protein
LPKAWTDVVTHRLTLYRPDPARGRVAAHWVMPVQLAAGDFLTGQEEGAGAA